MSNELNTVNAQSACPSVVSAENVHSGSGDIFSNVGTVNYIYNYFNQQYFPDEDLPEFYNLFVIPKQSFDGVLTFPKSKSLNESIESDIRKRFACFSKEAQEDILKIPCIFATPNRQGRNTDENHLAAFGFIKSIKDAGDFLKIEYAVNAQINQQRLNENEAIFQIQHAAESNELEHVHWTIKRVNIRRLLRV